MIEVSATSLLYNRLLLNITIAKHHSAINGFFLYKNLC